jgi:sulfur-carrier protein
MKLTIKYFASIREKSGFAEEVVEIDVAQITIDDLREQLVARGARMAVALDSEGFVRVAVNHDMVVGTFLVCHDSEIAFFPPVTAG